MIGCKTTCQSGSLSSCANDNLFKSCRVVRLPYSFSYCTIVLYICTRHLDVALRYLGLTSRQLNTYIYIYPYFFISYVNPACLPDSISAPVDGTSCWITGWGTLKSGGSPPEILQQVSVPIVSRDRCDKAYRNALHDSMICAGPDKGGKDSCQGDSGGPMVCKIGDRFYLQGVTSWGHGCASPGKFGVYAKVKYLLQWLREEMDKN